MHKKMDPVVPQKIEKCFLRSYKQNYFTRDTKNTVPVDDSLQLNVDKYMENVNEDLIGLFQKATLSIKGNRYTSSSQEVGANASHIKKL